MPHQVAVNGQMWHNWNVLIILLMAAFKLLKALMMASTSVTVGCVTHLCLKNTVRDSLPEFS